MSQTDSAMSNNVSILPTSGEPRRNPSMEFEPEWLEELHVNTSAVERRAASIPARRDWFSDRQAESRDVLRHAVNVKSVWAPSGE